MHCALSARAGSGDVYHEHASAQYILVRYTHTNTHTLHSRTHTRARYVFITSVCIISCTYYVYIRAVYIVSNTLIHRNNLYTSSAAAAAVQHLLQRPRPNTVSRAHPSARPRPILCFRQHDVYEIFFRVRTCVGYNL